MTERFNIFNLIKEKLEEIRERSLNLHEGPRFLLGVSKKANCRLQRISTVKIGGHRSASYYCNVKDSETPLYCQRIEGTEIRGCEAMSDNCKAAECFELFRLGRTRVENQQPLPTSELIGNKPSPDLKKMKFL